MVENENLLINPALVNSHLPKSTTHEEYMKTSFLYVGYVRQCVFYQGLGRKQRCESGMWLRIGKG